MLALAAIIACTAGFATLGEWQGVYDKFGSGGVVAFVNGGGNILANGLGLDPGLGATILSVMAILFAATTMDTGLRLQRYVVQEAGEIVGIKPLQNATVSTVVALGFCLALAFGAGGDGAGGMVIWPLFGTTNQLLAGLTLAILSVILIKQRRSVWFTAIPLAFLLVMSLFALLVQLGQFYNEQKWLLLGMDVVILVAALWVAFEAIGAMARGAGPAVVDEARG
nr:carbon starvation CstA 5TM domain-containing protein [Lysobacter penaei]